MLNRKKTLVSIIAIIVIVSILGTALAYTPAPSISLFPFTKARNYYQGPALMAQRIMYDHGYSSCDPDGWFGTVTTATTKLYQTEKGISVDGLIGTGTWYQLQCDMVEVYSGSDYIEYRGGGSGNHTIWHDRYPNGGAPHWWAKHKNGLFQGMPSGY